MDVRKDLEDLRKVFPELNITEEMIRDKGFSLLVGKVKRGYKEFQRLLSIKPLVQIWKR
jgi:hypothetical protein